MRRIEGKVCEGYLRDESSSSIVGNPQRRSKIEKPSYSSLGIQA